MNVEIGTDRKIQRILGEAALVDPKLIMAMAETLFNAAVNGLVSNCWDVVLHPYPDNVELRYKDLMTIYIDGMQAEIVMTRGSIRLSTNLLGMALIAPYLSYFTTHSAVLALGQPDEEPLDLEKFWQEAA